MEQINNITLNSDDRHIEVFINIQGIEYHFSKVEVVKSVSINGDLLKELVGSPSLCLVHRQHASNEVDGFRRSIAPIVLMEVISIRREMHLRSLHFQKFSHKLNESEYSQIIIGQLEKENKQSVITIIDGLTGPLLSS